VFPATLHTCLEVLTRSKRTLVPDNDAALVGSLIVAVTVAVFWQKAGSESRMNIVRMRNLKDMCASFSNFGIGSLALDGALGPLDYLTFSDECKQVAALGAFALKNGVPFYFADKPAALRAAYLF
jgi:hypothetical protein